MRPYDLLTFDCFGTLIDWESGIKGAISSLSRELGARLPAEEMVSRYVKIEFGLEQSPYRSYREILSAGLRLLFEEKGVRLKARQAGALASSLPRWPAFPEVGGVLRALRRMGYRLGILSNVDDALLKKSLRHLPVPFDYIVTAEQVRSYKPCPRHWERVLSVSRVSRRRVLHVAASQLHDIIPARMLGLECAWINRRGERGAAAPTHAFPDLSPLKRLLAAA